MYGLSALAHVRTYVHVGMWGWGQVCACVHVHVHVCARGHANERRFARISFRVSFSFCHVCMRTCVWMSFFIAYPGGHVSMWAGVHVGMWASGYVGKWASQFAPAVSFEISIVSFRFAFV